MKPLILPSSIACVMLFNVAAQAALPDQISGTVRDTNGAPAVGLEVMLLPKWIFEQSVLKTDSGGRFAIKTRNVVGQNDKPVVLIRDPNRNLAVARDMEEGIKNYDLQLAPGLIISGQVQDVQGKPLTNATVRVVLWTDNEGWMIENENMAEFDAQGHFKVSVLPVGQRYSVQVSAPGYGLFSTNVQELDANGLELPPCTLNVADQKIAGIVLDAEEKPVKGASVWIYGRGQPNISMKSDEDGRFVFKVCEGIITVSASTSGANSSYGNIQSEGGDTNIVVRLGQQGMNSRPQRASLLGKPLPDLTVAGISADAIQTNKPLLICLFDPEQRPSRRVLRLLGEQNDALKQKGVTVVGISVALTTTEALKEWKQSNPQPFLIGAVTEKTDKTKWLLNTEKFPWLILTDAQGRVKAEGFDLEELDTKLK